MSELLDRLRQLINDLNDGAGGQTDPAPGGPPRPVGPNAPPPASEAMRVMRELNPNAFMAVDGGHFVAIEDAWDCREDGRLFRLEYVATLDGRKAVAFCRSNPWNRDNPQNGHAITRCHVFADGLICLGSDHARTPADSPRDLRDTVLRARFWATAFSVLEETGTFPSP